MRTLGLKQFPRKDGQRRGLWLVLPMALVRKRWNAEGRESDHGDGRAGIREGSS